MSMSKDWSATLNIANCVLWFLHSELVVVTQRKYERLLRVVCCVCINLRAAPFEGSEASDFPVELSPDDCESVSDTVALLVELLGTEPMLACFVK